MSKWSTRQINQVRVFGILIVIALVSLLVYLTIHGFLLYPFLAALRIINTPLIYPTLYWITYISALSGILTVIFTYLWYIKYRGKFSTPVKSSRFRATHLFFLLIGGIVFFQLVLSYLNLSLLLQISFYLFLVSSIFLIIRSVIYLTTSLFYWQPGETKVNPLVSIIVPAYNEEKVITNTLKSLFQLNYDRTEIIVVDDGSTDSTIELVHQFSNYDHLKLVRQPNMGKWQALNTGVEVSFGQLIACIDADTILLPDALDHLILHFQNPEVVAVSGNIKVGNRQSHLTRLQALEYIAGLNILKRSEAFFQRITVIPGPLGIFRKMYLMKAGLFSPDTFAEDADMTFSLLKYGQIRYEPKAIGYTEAPLSLLDLFKQRYRWYRGLLQTMLKHKDMNLNPRYGLTGTLFIPWIYLNNLIFSWVAYFTTLWLFILMFIPVTGFVIYQPDASMPQLSTTAIQQIQEEGLSILLDLAVVDIVPSIYIIWFFFFFSLEILSVIYSVYIDVKEKYSIAPYSILFKLFYGYIIDTFRFLCHLEELLGYPMKWETTTRTNSMTPIEINAD